jgi:4-carboxymuconolactone decarboxylase
MGRLSEINLETLDTQQRAIYEDILLSRNGNIDGPFIPWLHSPVLADRAQKLGAFCRFDSSLPPRLSELAILITARHWRAEVEWLIHAPIAAEAGVCKQIIEALQEGQAPVFVEQDEALVYDLAIQLYDNKRVSTTTYDAAVAVLGESGVVDLVGILGYYALVAMTLNVFEIELSDNPGDAIAPFSS